MPAPRRQPAGRSRPLGLRVRLFLSFLVPTLLLGIGGLVVCSLFAGGAGTGASRAMTAGLLFLALVIGALFLATGLALHLGDRIARPVAWLLHLMENGPAPPGRPLPPGGEGWEMEALTRRVQVLLRQNHSGVQAMEELEALREELDGVLAVAARGELDPDRWPTTRATHPLTRRLLDFFRARGESLRDAREGLIRLQGLLEQDWRDETRSVEEIAKRSERCFLGQTEMALELERLEKLAGPAGASPVATEEAPGLLADLRLGIERWRREVAVALNGARRARVSGDARAPRLSPRVPEWESWIDESLTLLEETLPSPGEGEGSVPQVSGRIGKVAQAASEAGREMSALSREAAQLQRTWVRLGERLRSLMVRVGEVHAGAGGALAEREEAWESSAEEGSGARDGTS